MTLLSTDGAGALPTVMIDKALAHGWTVQAAFDADKGGDLLWRRLGEHYPPETAQRRSGVSGRRTARIGTIPCATCCRSGRKPWIATRTGDRR